MSWFTSVKEAEMWVVDIDKTALNLRWMMSVNDVKASRVALELGVHRATVYGWLNGVSAPNLDHCVGLCGILGCGLDDLVGRKRV